MSSGDTHMTVSLNITFEGRTLLVVSLYVISDFNDLHVVIDQILVQTCYLSPSNSRRPLAKC